MAGIVLQSLCEAVTVNLFFSLDLASRNNMRTAAATGKVAAMTMPAIAPFEISALVPSTVLVEEGGTAAELVALPSAG